MARVLQIGQGAACALAAKHLLDVGLVAKVLCVSDENEGALVRVLNRGKQRLAIACVTPSALRRHLAALLGTVDVVIQDERVFAFDECVARNPRVVLCDVPAFAAGDAAYARLPAWDAVVMAAAGLFKDMGWNRTLLGVEASYTDLLLPSAYGALFAALGVACALRAGRAEHIEAPLASALAEALVHNSLHVARHPSCTSERERKLRDGEYPLTRAELEAAHDPFFRTYRCADGRPLHLVCPSHRKHQLSALRVLGVDAEDLPRVDPYTECTPGLGASKLGPELAATLRPRLVAAFEQQDAFEWEARLGAAGVPAIAHRTVDEWKVSAHAVRSGLWHPVARELAPVAWEDDARPSSAHPCSAHPSSSSRPRPCDRPGPLGDVRVVDMCNVIAGPTIGSRLALFGADVIKVDPTRPSYAPDVSILYGVACNRGKRSVLLDATSTAGRAALEALLRTADVLLVNCTKACLRRLRLARDDLARINPDLILMRFDAWGGPTERGAFADYLGYDDNVQCAIGITAHFGLGLDAPEEHAHVGTIDVIAGVAGALAVVAALKRRDVDGVVVTARTSLAAVGQYVNVRNMLGDAPPMVPGPGAERRGEHACLRIYRAADGWLLVAACERAEDVPRHLPRVQGAVGSDHVEAALARMPTAEACARLFDVGVAAVPLRDLAQVRHAHLVTRVERGVGAPTFQFELQKTHPMGVVTIAAPVAVRMRGRYGTRALSPAPKYGAHTREVLSALGHAKALLLDAAAEEWCSEYVPFAPACDACSKTESKALPLGCGHQVCARCLTTDACPTCGKAHGVDDVTLRMVLIAEFRAGYGRWRRGLGAGARDLRERPPGHARTRSV